jgi:hypothetical protein
VSESEKPPTLTTPKRNRLIIGFLLAVIIGVPALGTLYALVAYSFIGVPLALLGACLAGELRWYVEEVIIRG